LNEKPLSEGKLPNGLDTLTRSQFEEMLSGPATSSTDPTTITFKNSTGTNNVIVMATSAGSQFRANNANLLTNGQQQSSTNP
jgi:hypothetical protein